MVTFELPDWFEGVGDMANYQYFLFLNDIQTESDIPSL